MGASNPVIYDNDIFDDIIDFDYLLCKASLGEVKLVGIIGTAVTPNGKYDEGHAGEAAAVRGRSVADGHSADYNSTVSGR